MEEFIPKGKLEVKTKPLWMSGEVNTAINNKRKKWKKYVFSGNLRQKEEYIKARKKVNSLIRRNKRRMEMMIAKEVSSNPKSFWNYVKSKTKVRTSIADIRETGGCLVTEDGRKAEILNEFFKKAFTIEDKTSFPQISHKYKLNTTFREIEFDKYQVESILEP